MTLRAHNVTRRHSSLAPRPAHPSFHTRGARPHEPVTTNNHITSPIRNIFDDYQPTAISEALRLASSLMFCKAAHLLSAHSHPRALAHALRAMMYIRTICPKTEDGAPWQYGALAGRLRSFLLRGAERLEGGRVLTCRLSKSLHFSLSADSSLSLCQIVDEPSGSHACTTHPLSCAILVLDQFQHSLKAAYSCAEVVFRLHSIQPKAHYPYLYVFRVSFLGSSRSRT